MIITAELSLYPLSVDYEDAIISFIKVLQSNTELSVKTHAMSTYVKGDNSTVLKAISEALEVANAKIETLSLVIKIINRDLPVEKGFLDF